MKIMTDGQTVELINGNDVGYTVPQHVRPEQMGDSTGIYFRVKSVHKEPCFISIKSGTAEIARLKRDHMAPGEMERISLTRDQLQNTTGKVSVSIEEGGTK